MIVFDLETRGGRQAPSFFQFRFATENGGYAGYTLQSIGDADGDGHRDLAFHVLGDGPARPEVTVVLLDRGDRFVARTTGFLRCECTISGDLDLVTGSGGATDRVLARWRPEAGRFEGNGVLWVLGEEAALHEAVRANAPIVARVPGGTAIRRLERGPTETWPRGWIHVAVDGVEGWMSEHVVTATSPTPEEIP